MKKQPLSVEETEKLVDLISWAVNGTEHGVITYDRWKAKCNELSSFLNDRGYQPHGFWMLAK